MLNFKDIFNSKSYSKKLSIFHKTIRQWTLVDCCILIRNHHYPVIKGTFRDILDLLTATYLSIIYILPITLKIHLSHFPVTISHFFQEKDRYSHEQIFFRSQNNHRVIKWKKFKQILNLDSLIQPDFHNISLGYNETLQK